MPVAGVPAKVIKGATTVFNLMISLQSFYQRKWKKNYGETKFYFPARDSRAGTALARPKCRADTVHMFIRAEVTYVWGGSR